LLIIDIFIAEGTVTYTVAGDRTLDPIPICSVFTFVPGTELIHEYRAYIDFTPLLVATGKLVTADENGKLIVIPREEEESRKRPREDLR
jgi:hypothetical protein